jgi:hypothetical protein
MLDDAIEPAANQAEVTLHAEIRKHVLSLKDKQRKSFIEQYGLTCVWPLPYWKLRVFSAASAIPSSL